MGSLRPQSPLGRIMSDVDGQICDRPCLFGIRPGITTLERAAQILHTHPLTHDAVWQNAHTLQLNGPDAFIAFSATADGFVDSIVLSDNLTDTGIAIPNSLVDSVNVAETLRAFGQPLVGLPGSDYVALQFANGISVASAAPNDYNTLIGPHMPVSILLMTTVPKCAAGHSEDIMRPWIGTATLRQYLNIKRFTSVVGRNSGVPIPPDSPCTR